MSSDPTTKASAPTPSSTARPAVARPRQARSRQRAEAMLQAARDLIAAGGIADLKMAEVARRADVPIGSLYQYFPTRTALIGRLHEIEMGHVSSVLVRAMARARTRRDVLDQVRPVLEEIVALHAERPQLAAIWWAPAYEADLRAPDLADTARNARLIADRFLDCPGPNINPDEIIDAWMLILHLASELVRLVAVAGDGIGLADPFGSFDTMVRARMDPFIAQ